MTSRSDELTSDLEWAVSVAQAKLAANPNDPTVHNALGVIEAAAGDPVHALTRFEHAIVLCPRYAEAHVNRGLALEVLARPEDAFLAFAAARELTPDYTEAEEKVLGLAAQLGRTVPDRTWPAPSWMRSLSRGLFAPRAASQPLPTRDKTQLRARLA